jgi:hypothetical protein
MAMRVHLTRIAVTLCCAASLAAAAGAPSAARPAAPAAAPSAAAPSAAAQARLPVLMDCLGHAQVRPASFVLACGDGNSRLGSLHWSQWGAASARAEGVNAVNDCKPYCAAGRFHSYRVEVRLDRPAPWKNHPQLSHYGRITLVYEDGRPQGFPRTVTYPLWN